MTDPRELANRAEKLYERHQEVRRGGSREVNTEELLLSSVPRLVSALREQVNEIKRKDEALGLYPDYYRKAQEMQYIIDGTDNYEDSRYLKLKREVEEIENTFDAALSPTTEEG